MSEYTREQELTTEQQLAYEWAKSQHFTSVAASHARTLAYAVSELLDELQTLQAERDKLIEGLKYIALNPDNLSDFASFQYVASKHLEYIGVNLDEANG